MKWNKGRVFFIILTFVMIWLTSQSIRDAMYIKTHYTTVSIRFFGCGVTERNLRMALESEKSRETRSIPEVTAWSWLKKTMVRNVLLNRSADIAEITVCSNMAVTAPMELIYGNYTTDADKSGCVIDASTSYKLFGTEGAIGNTIVMGDTDYVIRGIVKTNYPVVLIQGNDDTFIYSNLEFTYDDCNKGIREKLASEFILRNDLPADYAIIDGNFYGEALSTALCLPVWIFYILISLSFIIYYIRQRKRLKICPFILYGIFGLAMISGYGIILYSFTGQPFYLPEKILPTRWSDFRHWETIYNMIRSQIRQMKYLVPNSKDVFLEYGIAGLLPNITVLAITYLLIYVQGKKILAALKL